MKLAGVGMTSGGCSGDGGLGGRRCSVEAVAHSVARDDGLDAIEKGPKAGALQ